MFPGLQKNPDNLLVESSTTRDALLALGQKMKLAKGSGGPGDSNIPAAYTYLGQFIAHDITAEASSAALAPLTDPAIKPLTVDQIRDNLKNLRTGTLDLDSIYHAPAPRNGNRLMVGKVSPLNMTTKPNLRPTGWTRIATWCKRAGPCAGITSGWCCTTTCRVSVPRRL